MEINAKCACVSKKPCEGICKEKNLLRKRAKLEICPAAYGKEVTEHLRTKK